ncbi:hypothetical protein [Duganella callida]|uniref:Lipoprotein n=1 Tax=Duganella callida TaxID=2561932 RepID=A0A4Y9SDU3_9BURK|nr:hypothetical protein [Duganella callida]TFW18034.1 hypothetical protein E4L98_19575 [Duganella callida]
MQCISFRSIFKFFAVAMSIMGCSTPQKMSADQLTSIGVSAGNTYWSVEQKLASSGYQCFVSGAKRENFDCTEKEGFFPSCILRVEFSVDESNVVSSLRIAEPACIGTP